MYGDLATEVEYLLREGATYQMAPDLGADIFDRLAEFQARFLVWPDERSRVAHLLWTVHTWFMDCWDHTPRLLFVSPEAGSGKTRALEVTETLVPRPDFVGSLTPAALYHSIDDAMERDGGRPTVLYDELDTVFGNADEGRIRNYEMRQLIDIGHSKSATIKRRVGKKTVRYQPYAALALAGMMTVYDVPATIRTRSVVIPMQRKRPTEKVERWDRRRSPKDAEPVRWMLQCWAELVHEHALEYRPDLPDQIESRDADVWEPLIAVADMAGGRWPELARVTAVTAVTASGVRTTPSDGVELMEDIRTVFIRRRTDVVFTATLLSDLGDMDRRWSRLDGKRLARMLHGYGVNDTNNTQRIGTRTAKGYRREYFTDAWDRYLPAVTTVTAVTDSEGE